MTLEYTPAMGIVATLDGPALARLIDVGTACWGMDLKDMLNPEDIALELSCLGDLPDDIILNGDADSKISPDALAPILRTLRMLTARVTGLRPVTPDPQLWRIVPAAEAAR